MGKLGNFVEKFIGENKKQRWVIESTILYELFRNMGIIDDMDSLTEIYEHLDEQKIDINFGVHTGVEYKKFKQIDASFKVIKRLKISSRSVNELIKKVDSIKVPVDNEWMERYRKQEEGEVTKEEEPTVVGDDINTPLNNLQNRIREIEERAHVTKLSIMSDEDLFEHAMNQVALDNN